MTSHLNFSIVFFIANHLFQFDCPEYSSCVNRKGGYSCKCDPGFKPMRYANKTLKACVDIDECHEKKDG